MNTPEEGEARVLVVDDEEGIRHALRVSLTRAGYQVDVAENAGVALEKLQRQSRDVVLCDIRMPGDLDGLGFLEVLQSRGVPCDVIMMSAYGSRETALEAVRKGAYDYISKPIQSDDLLLALRKLFEKKRLHQENQRLRAALREAEEDCGIVARSASMRKIIEKVRRAAVFPTSILIQGETGTGKGLLARAIHMWSGRRNDAPVEVNCGAIPGNLLESELFGYVRGAFTGADRDKQGLIQAAHGGTLFLDEVGELPLELQVKLLRVLEEGTVRRLGETAVRPVDVRIVSATNRDLQEEVKQGRFRGDLFFRLNVYEVLIPSLRERIEDIPLLVDTYLQRYNISYKVNLDGVSPEAMRALMAYSWPGNVRELKNVIESAIVQEYSSTLTLDSLPEHIRHPGSSEHLSSATSASRTPPQGDDIWIPEGLFSIKEATRRVEELLISRALAYTDGNRSAAARLLKISHRALLYKLKDYDLG